MRTDGTTTRRYSHHLCERMPEGFAIEWTDAQAPALRFERDDEEGVTTYLSTYVDYCPFCGADLQDERFQWKVESNA